MVLMTPNEHDQKPELTLQSRGSPPTQETNSGLRSIFAIASNRGMRCKLPGRLAPQAILEKTRRRTR